MNGIAGNQTLFVLKLFGFQGKISNIIRIHTAESVTNFLAPVWGLTIQEEPAPHHFKTFAGPEDMETHARLYAEKGLRFIFDPGQQIPRLTPEQLVIGITGAYALVSNDYELEMICKLTGLNLETILERTPVVITTLGGKGSRISRRDGSHSDVGVARINDLKDPTGAGDSYRAGIIKGILHGMSLEDSAALGAVCASFCVEKYGTQTLLR